MRVTIAGFLTDHKSRVLLQQPEPGRLSPVVVSLGAAGLPADALAHAFRAATGLIIWPVRLVGVYFMARDGAELTLTYRCTLRGGELQPPPGQPPAAFCDTAQRPPGLSAAHARQLDDALGHPGGPALAARLTGRLWDGLRRSKGGQPDDPPDWTATVRLVIDAGHGQVAWTRTTAAERWRLPAAPVGRGEAPWEAARRLQKQLTLHRAGLPLALRLILLNGERMTMTIVFVAGDDQGAGPRGPGEKTAFVAPGAADERFDAADRALAAELLAAPDMTLVRLEG
jgi:hypothetical protein